MAEKTATAARQAINARAWKWDQEHTRQFKVKLNCRTDADIIARLEQVENTQGYIKRLIREDLQREENGTMTRVQNEAGSWVDFDQAVELMDDDLREQLHAEGYETEQAFFTAYEAAHAAKYGAPWALSEAHPQY